MKATHLSDHEIQLVVSDCATCTQEVVQHVNTCSGCTRRVETYRLLFTALDLQPKPAFDFDLAALVLPNGRITEKTHPPTSALSWIIIGIVAATIGAATYLFSGYLVTIFSTVPTAALDMIFITAATFLAFQSTDIIKNYKKHISNLNLY